MPIGEAEGPGGATSISTHAQQRARLATELYPGQRERCRSSVLLVAAWWLLGPVDTPPARDGPVAQQASGGHSALRESGRHPGAGLFRQRHHRGPDHGPVQGVGFAGDRAGLRVCLPRTARQGRDRSPRSWTWTMWSWAACSARGTDCGSMSSSSRHASSAPSGANATTGDERRLRGAGPAHGGGHRGTQGRAGTRRKGVPGQASDGEYRRL